MARRFRRRLKSKRWRTERIKRLQYLYNQSRSYRLMGKQVNSFYDAFNCFMPNHVQYLLMTEESPFFNKKLQKNEFLSVRELKVPSDFSIISNPVESYQFLRQLSSCIYYQSCRQLWIDYVNCSKCDLTTQVFLDSILIDYSKFLDSCNRANVEKYLRLDSFGGKNINDSKLRSMIYSVGSPVELLNRPVKFSNIIPFRLRHIDGEKTVKKLRLGQKEIDTSDLIQYVIDCLSRFGKTLSQQARQDLGNVIGETISNAEEHSSLHNRYLIGYMEETHSEESHYGILNLVMMNTGNTIYETFKYPNEDGPINYDCISQMKALSDRFNKRNLFRPNSFTEENLWTLYSLQGGVSRIPPSVRKRGNGTIEFINSFFSLKGAMDVDPISKMSIISGHTQIDFDGNYKIIKSKNELGESISRVTFNSTNSLNDKPDSNYVYHIKHYFPGTIICAQLLINDDDLL